MQSRFEEGDLTLVGSVNVSDGVGQLMESAFYKQVSTKWVFQCVCDQEWTLIGDEGSNPFRFRLYIGGVNARGEVSVLQFRNGICAEVCFLN